jgi:hypothetical protein
MSVLGKSIGEIEELGWKYICLGIYPIYGNGSDRALVRGNVVYHVYSAKD